MAKRRAQPSTAESFGQRLARIRKDRGFTQTELGDTRWIVAICMAGSIRVNPSSLRMRAGDRHHETASCLSLFLMRKASSNFFDDDLVIVGQAIDFLELAQEVAVLQSGRGGLAISGPTPIT